MIEIQKEDIPVLDFIIEKCLETGQDVTANELIKEKFLSLTDKDGYSSLTPEYNISKQFTKYLYILDKYGVCDCSFEEDAEFARANPKTLLFKEQGGFEKLYETLLKEKENDEFNRKREKLEFELAESNIRANKLNEKNSKRNKRETIINIILGIINIGLLIWQIITAE